MMSKAMDYTRVSVYYLSSDGGDWALYLQNKLNTPEYHLDTVLNDLLCDKYFHTVSARLNVFLITPNFLDSYVYFHYLENFEKRNCILILTGIEHTELEMEATSRDCTYLLDWCIHELRGDEKSVRDLMIRIIEVYEGHLDLDHKHSSGSSWGGTSVDERDSFSEMYKRLPSSVSGDSRPGSWGDSVSSGDDNRVSDYDKLPVMTSKQANKVVDIVQKGDKVYILLERSPDGPLSIQFPGEDLTAEYHRKAAVCSFNCKDIESPSFIVISDGAKLSSGRLQGRPESLADLELYDCPTTPYAHIATQTDADQDPISDPDTATWGNNAEHLANVADSNKRGADLSKRVSDTDLFKRTSDTDSSKRESDTDNRTSCESDQPDYEEVLDTEGHSKLEIVRNILEEEAYPERLLCKAFGVEDNDIDVLDEKLAGMVEGLDALRKLTLPAEMHETSDEDPGVWPSLLHFGAQYNLKKFCTVLANNKLVHHACAVPNVHGMMPHELAQKYGHVELAQMLEKIQVEDAENSTSKYDSGFGGECVQASRLSGPGEPHEDTRPLPPLPVPHDIRTGSGGYFNMGPQNNRAIAGNTLDEDEALNEMLGDEQAHHPLHHANTEPKYFAPSPVTEVKLPVKHHKKHGFFASLLHVHVHTSKKHQPPVQAPRRHRRCSEPTIPSHIQEQLQQNQDQALQNKKNVHYHKEQLQVPGPAPPMCEGARTRQIDQGRHKSLHKRKSMRIAHAMKDTSLKGPNLPPRKKKAHDIGVF